MEGIFKGAGKALSEGRKGDAVALFLKFLGAPADRIEGMMHSPVWTAFEGLPQHLLMTILSC